MFATEESTWRRSQYHILRSFFASLECELLQKRRFRTHAKAKMAIFDYIEAWYNPKRRHSALGRVSPIDYERRYHTAA